jgi:phosphoribosylaminoimidazole-succinocarboxamide synthase
MTETSDVMLKSEVPGFPCHRGKVRDVYDLGAELLLVATDRISALDWVFPNGVPMKGRVLTKISRGWFKGWLGGLVGLEQMNHFKSTDLQDFPEPFRLPEFAGRTTLCRKADEVIPYECIVRGYIAGSALKEYKKTGNVCGIALPSGLRDGDKLEEPLFTPSTKAETGHDENIPFEVMHDKLGNHVSSRLRKWSLALYKAAHEYALTRGIIIADTKFEFGMLDGHLMLIDEVLTPDSSRFWPVDTYRPGWPQQSLDKQPVRDWLETLPESVWDKKSPPPPLPEEQVAATRKRYLQIYRLLSNGNGMQ